MSPIINYTVLISYHYLFFIYMVELKIMNACIYALNTQGKNASIHA